MVKERVYCIDTSSLVEMWVRSYPPDVIPPLWTKVEALISHGRLYAPEEVLRELQKKEDGLYKWAKAQNGLFVPIDREQWDRAKQIVAEFRPLIKAIKNRSTGDPWVITLADLRGYTVVTEEARGTPDRPKIPDVCAQLGVEHINVLQLIRAEQWKFGP